jgi:two-component sensor histidine kinase
MADVLDRVETDAAQPAYPNCYSTCSLLAETDHRTANQLTMLSSYIRLKERELEDELAASPALQRLLISIDAQIRAVGRVHRLLTNHGGDGRVALAPMLSEVCEPFADALQWQTVIIQAFSPDCSAPAEHSLWVSQIVVEAILNALKHGQPGGHPARIMARCGQDEAGRVVVVVSDDGVGLPEGFDSQTGGGLGFRLMRAHARALNAALTFSSSAGGLSVTLTLPAAG